MSKYTTEIHVKVFNDENGSYILVRPDADALGCIEIRPMDSHKDINAPFILIDPAVLPKLIDALQIVADSMEENK